MKKESLIMYERNFTKHLLFILSKLESIDAKLQENHMNR